MKQQKLTAQIAAAYYGAPCRVYMGNQFAEDVVCPSVLRGIERNLPNRRYVLVLTPLASIPNDDAIEVAKILSAEKYSKSDIYVPVVEWKEDRVHVWTGGHGVCVIMHTGEVNWGIRKDGVTATIGDLYKAIDFLRSRGYDLGHGPIKSLIEAGIADDIRKDA